LIRWHKRDFVYLADMLSIPSTFALPKSGERSGLVCFLYCVWRLGNPSTLIRLTLVWGEGRGTLYEMFSVCITFLYHRWALHLVKHLCVQAVLPKCPEFAEKIHAKGAPLTRCWGFIDGTIRKTCRPTYFQRYY
ncbi:unnamed protein product, partial [Chrysoparadoxa australica]